MLSPYNALCSRFDGIEEIPGKDYNPIILDIVKKWFPNAVDDGQYAWCAMGLIVALDEEGYDVRPGTPMARSFLKIGASTEDMISEHTIVILWRGSPTSTSGHVTIFMGWANKEKTKFYGYGANQNDKVGTSTYDVSKIIGLRKLQSRYQIQRSSIVLVNNKLYKEVVYVEYPRYKAYSKGHTPSIKTKRALIVPGMPTDIIDNNDITHHRFKNVYKNGH